MRDLPVVKSRRLNKILCLIFTAGAACFLIFAALFRAADKEALCYTFFVLSVILAGFGAFYGVLWFIFADKENKVQKKIEEIEEYSESSDQKKEYREFILPKKEMTESAKKRFEKIVRLMPVMVIVLFVLIYGIQFFTAGFAGWRHLLTVLLFCILICVPGILLQYAIYRYYVGRIPNKISFYQEKLYIDKVAFLTKQIREIRISSEKLINRYSPSLYRQLTIDAEDGSCSYLIDYRAENKEAPHWPEYGNLVEELRKWAEENRIELKVNYMD